MSAPVRVASDGDNGGSGLGAGSSAGDQTTTGSSGAAQIGPLAVGAPIWVASDGDSSAPSGASGGDQTTSGSTGAAQLGPVMVDTPIRVASDGDEVVDGSGDTGTNAQGEPVSPLDGVTGTQGGPVAVTETGGGPGMFDGSSTSAGFGSRPTSRRTRRTRSRSPGWAWPCCS